MTSKKNATIGSRESRRSVSVRKTSKRSSGSVLAKLRARDRIRMKKMERRIGKNCSI